MPPLKIKLSSTALGKSACSLNLWRTVVEGYRPPLMSAKVVYGIAVHKFIDTMYKTGDIGLAFTKAKKAFDLPKVDDRKAPHISDQKHLITTCANLWSGFMQDDSTFDVLQIDGVPLTEQTFSIKSFYEDDIISVDLEGTLDKIGQFKGGCFAVGDWKTTSSWSSAAYFERYELSRQLRLYRLACIHASRVAPDSTLGRIGKTKMGCFIDAIFIKPNANENEVKRSEIYQYSNDDMIAFELSLKRKCAELSDKIACNVHLFKEGILNGSCEGKWGLCQFWNVCQAPANVAALLLERDFVKVVFNPMDYNSLEEL